MKFVISAAFQPPERLVALARAADELGYEAIAFPDHVVYPAELDTPYPYTEDGKRRYDENSEFPDPWVTIGALATVTERLKFTNNVFVLPLRNPYLAAKQIATAARFARGRLILTIGVGWSEVEFDLMGQSFKRRGARADEMIGLLRDLWSGQMIEGKGEFYSYPKLQMTPPFPIEPIPVWVGGISDLALRRAARNDGWLSDLQTSADILDSVEKIGAYRKELGREGPFDVMAMPMDADDLDAFRRLEDGGVTHVLTNPWVRSHGFTDDLDKQREGMKQFAAEVMASFG
ncbi:MAG: TIGR03619 family F420-dependent LLM class oxidoreductase [bacterium]|nr:TIGR03619 family F420-dependent LLM class oxidoreductase [bacterium]